MKIKSSKELVEKALKQVKSIDLKQLKTLIDTSSCTIIDVRDIRELYNTGTLTNALHIPRGMIEFWVDEASPYYKKGEFDSEKNIVIFCAAGERSALAAKTLLDMGYKKVFHVKKGYKAISESGLFQLSELKKKK